MKASDALRKKRDDLWDKYLSAVLATKETELVEARTLRCHQRADREFWIVYQTEIAEDEAARKGATDG